MRSRTKIICTLGPAVASRKKIGELLDAGMNVARINMSHGSHKEHSATIALLKEVRAEKNAPLAIMLDTKGPEIRVAPFEKEKLPVTRGMRLCIHSGEKTAEPLAITLTPPSIVADIPIGAKVLFCDGYISSHVVEKNEKGVIVEIENSGEICQKNGVNIPHVDLDLPAVTEKDIDDIYFGCEQGIDLLAASFIRSAEHIFTIKELLISKKAFHVLVIAKIENALGVNNIDAILQAADGMMVARGDLGVELPLHEVPNIQKMMIQKCNQVFKPVITATQMLDSMIKNPRPTRAEVSDVANAVYDGTDMVMLSGETAVGLYPIEAVRVMKQTALAAEKDTHYRTLFYQKTSHCTFHSLSPSIALAAVRTAYISNGKGLITLTTRGFTARMIASFRPEIPIIAITPSEQAYHQLACAWGVLPLLKKVEDISKGIKEGSMCLLDQQLAEYGDLIVVTSGTPFGISGTTNMMMIDHIGEVKVRGKPGIGKKVSAPVALIASFDPENTYPVKGKLVVIPHCDQRYTSLLAESAGIILQNHPDDRLSEECARCIAKEAHIPLLVRADTACFVLKEGEEVTLDPSKGVVFAKTSKEMVF